MTSRFGGVVVLAILVLTGMIGQTAPASGQASSPDGNEVLVGGRFVLTVSGGSVKFDLGSWTSIQAAPETFSTVGQESGWSSPPSRGEIRFSCNVNKISDRVKRWSDAISRNESGSWRMTIVLYLDNTPMGRWRLRDAAPLSWHIGSRQSGQREILTEELVVGYSAIRTI